MAFLIYDRNTTRILLLEGRSAKTYETPAAAKGAISRLVSAGKANLGDATFADCRTFYSRIEKQVKVIDSCTGKLAWMAINRAIDLGEFRPQVISTHKEGQKMELNEAQILVLENHENGEFEHLKDATSQDDLDALLDECGDSLLRYLMAELADSNDCDDIPEAASRVERSISQLQSLLGVLEQKIDVDPGIHHG